MPCFIFWFFWTKIEILMAKLKSPWRTGQVQNHPQNHPNLKITKQFYTLVFLVIECIFTLSRFKKKKLLRSFKNPSVQCDFQSEIKQSIKHSLKGPIWHLKFIFGSWIFLSYSTKIDTFWSIILYDFFDQSVIRDLKVFCVA